MQFSKFAKTPAPAPAEPETETEDLKDAAPEPAPKKEVAKAQPKAGAVTLFSDDDAAAEGAGLMAMASAADRASGESGESGASDMLFPILQVTGGASGGQWKLVGEVPKEVARLFMPVTADDSVDGVLVGYRVEMVAWPSGGRDDGEEKATRPAWTAVLPGTATATARDLFLSAAEAFNFTKGVDKHKFDFAESDVGHLRPSFQCLVYVPGPQGLVVVQPPALFQSWIESAEGLAKLVDPKTKRLGRFPVRVSIKSRAVKYGNGHANKVHRLVFDKATDSDGAEWLDSFKLWREHAVDHEPELAEAVNGWLSGVDAPLTDEAVARLTKAKNLKPAR